MKIKDLKKIVDDAVESGHGDADVLIDTEAMSYDVHMVDAIRACLETEEETGIRDHLCISLDRTCASLNNSIDSDLVEFLHWLKKEMYCELPLYTDGESKVYANKIAKSMAETRREVKQRLYDLKREVDEATNDDSFITKVKND